MIWRVEYNKDDEFEKKSDAIGAYGVSSEDEPTIQARLAMWTVYENKTEYYVYVEALGKTEALVKAQRIFKEYFELLAKRAKDYIALKIDELKGFEVWDVVKVVQPGQQFSTHFEAMGGLLANAYDYGYRGEFTVGGSVTKYDLKTTAFTVIGKGQFEANGKEDMTLYMIAETTNAERHDWHNNHDKTREPLEVFVLMGKGLERW